MNRLLLAATAAVTLLAAVPASAQFQKPEDAVKYRQSAMFVMANHFGRIGAMVAGRAPYDAAAATANAEVVATMSRLPFIAYVEGTPGTAKGGASPKIWTERAKFDDGAKKMQDEIGKLLVAARSNNLDQIKTAFGAAGQSCKSCHDDFRNQ